MSERPSKELLTYAFIAQEYGASGSALDGVSQLLAHIVGRDAGKTFSPNEISTQVSSVLGLDLSPLVVESLVPALVRLGALEQIASADGVAAYKCKKISEEAYHLGESEINEILLSFRDFAKRLLSEHGLTATDLELDEAFLAFLVTADFLSSWLQTDKSDFKGNVLSLKKDDALTAELRLHRSLDTICALFAQESFASNTDLFNKLVEISWGAVVVEVITALQVGAAGDSGRLDDLTVFVDTPILLDLIGLGEEEQHRYASDLFDLLARSQAQIATFSHVIEEMRAAVEATLGRFSRGEPFSGPMAKRLRSEKGYELYARQTVALMESKLEAQGVQIISDAEFEGAEIVKYFPEENVDSLRSRVGELHRNVERRDRDAKSIAYVIRMRRGLTASPVSLSKYIFVTRNVELCRIATKYSQSEGLIARGTAPPCVTDRQLAGVLWFCAGAPASEGVALTRQKIIANCANAVSPRLDLVSKMGQVLFEHKPERLLEYEALMRDQRATMCLTRETLNVANLLDSTQAEALLEKMRLALATEQREAFEKEKAGLIESFEREKARVIENAEHSKTALVAEVKAEGELSIEQLQGIVSSLRSEHKNEREEMADKLSGMRTQIDELSETSRKAKNAVIESVTGEVKATARTLAFGAILVYGLAAWLVQSLSDVPYLGFVSLALFSASGFWLAPEYTLHPLIGWLLRRDAHGRLKKIQGYSGLNLDREEIVRNALGSIRIRPPHGDAK